MKKLLSVALLSLIIIAGSSCQKKLCTETNAPNFGSENACIDLTSNLVGTYVGSFEDSTLGQSSVKFIGETIVVTKVDDANILFTPSNQGLLPFKANVGTTGSDYYLDIPNQTSNGITISGFSYGSGANGAYVTSYKTLTSTVSYGDAAGTHAQSFIGVKQ